jgi:UDP-N-acetylmuramate--alanine ligase
MADFVAAHAAPGDLVVCLGAGTISTWANALPDELAKRGS